MSLGISKRTSNSKPIHRYENVSITSASSHRKKTQCRKYDSDYINVEFEDKSGRQIATIAEARKKPKYSSTDLDMSPTRSITNNSINSTDGEMQHQETAKNSLKLIRSSRGKSQRLHQINRIDLDSDSSSSDIQESNEVKKLELEHYNRLKLNLRCLPPNKKALKGIRILYDDAVPVEGKQQQQQSLQAALNSSTLFKQRQQQSLNEDSKESSSILKAEEHHTTPTKTYKKESHTNRIFSVTGRPNRYLSSTKHFSTSTGDVNNADTEDSSIEANFDQLSKSLKMAVQRPKPFSDSDTTKAGVFSTVPSGIRLGSAGLATAHSLQKTHYVLRDAQNTNDFHDLPSLTTVKPKLKLENESLERQYDRRSTSARLRDSVETESQTTKETVGFLQKNKHVSKPVFLHQERCQAACNYSSIHSFNAAETITFDQNGGQYTSQYHDIRITVPKGAIKKHAVVELQVKVTLHGPYTFPDEKRPISPIVWVGMSPNIKFKRPIEIRIPHFAEISPESLNEELIFLKTTDWKKTVKTYGKLYRFFQVAENNQHFNNNHGTVSTKEACFFCIAGDISSNSTLTANYCLLPVIPRQITQPTWKIHYYFTYLLKSYIHMIQCQLGQDWEILSPRKLNFVKVEGQNQATIETYFQRQLTDSGWTLSLESNNKIHESDLYLWGDIRTKMEVLETTGMYPPRFTIRVHGENARESSVAIIYFSGASELLTTEIPLLRSRMSISSTNTSTHTSVFSPDQTSRNSCNSDIRNSMQTSAQGLCCTCTGCLCVDDDYDHLPSGNIVDQSTKLMNIPTDDDLLTVATEIIKILQDNWTILQASLNIPDHIMLDILSQTPMHQQVFRLLKEWCTLTENCSKNNLAQCLYQADKRLHFIGMM